MKKTNEKKSQTSAKKSQTSEESHKSQIFEKSDKNSQTSQK